LEKDARWEELLLGFWNRSDPVAIPYTESFFPLAFFQPYAEHVAEKLPEPVSHSNSATCPVCDSEPVVGVLREEQLGAKRSFICSFCAHEWDFPRLVCPSCGEDRNEALAVYTSEYFDHIRLEVCDSCKTYVKAVDLTRHGLAIPVVDELAAIPLTIWAQQHGYSKLQPNLVAM
jgi:FdhE protein